MVSCNTTGLSRTLVPLYEHCGELSVECDDKRAADPSDSKKATNAIKLVLGSGQHGLDVMTVKLEQTSIHWLLQSLPQ